ENTNRTYTKSGLYYDTLYNQYGCDSLISLELTIPVIINEVQQEKNWFSSTQMTEYEYQWLRCDLEFEEISNETKWKLIADTLGSFALEISYMGCKDTSACFDVTYIPQFGCKLSKPSLVYPNPSNGN